MNLNLFLGERLEEVLVGRGGAGFQRHGGLELLQLSESAQQKRFGLLEGQIHLDPCFDMFLVFFPSFFQTRHVFLVEMLGRLDQCQEGVENVGIVVLVHGFILFIHISPYTC